ncbi:MAG TPA: response regulator, partial [Acidobacteriaceae bacterium]|nr:response regulator [Acidobacteriaceae bacterium]
MPETPSILIIDDDAVSREVMAMTLEMHGYAVAAAPDGESALAAVRPESTGEAKELPEVPLPDLILMDTQMPGLSGLELIAALRAAGVGRIVAISASEPGEAIRNAADGFLLKPVQPEAVAALLNASVAVVAASAEPIPVSAGASMTAADYAVDPQILAKFRAMMPAAAVREIYAATALDMKARLKTLEAAMRTEDLAEVSRIAHSIKGG